VENEDRGARVPDVARRLSTVLVFTGLPGTGKSTLAEKVATIIKAPAFAGDWLLGALKPFGVLAGLDRQTSLDLYYRLLHTLTARQLMLGQSAVLDCLVTDANVAAWRQQAAEFDARLVIVECVCSDEQVHRRRLEGRRRHIPGWHEIDWDHVERMRAEFPPLQGNDLSLDAMNPVQGNVETVLKYI
jgi:predicted kinase